jgi:peptidase S41-like protein
MSEKLYARLLQLFPKRFRDAYGEDALQLFRDRARDEQGGLPTLRLWLDLLADLAISVPREYFYAEPELLAARPRSGGVPSFYFLGEESPRPGALVFGTLLSVLALATFSALLSSGAVSRRTTTPARQRYSSASNASRSAKRTSAPTPATNATNPVSTGETASLSSGARTAAPQYDHPVLADPAAPPQSKSPVSSPIPVLVPSSPHPSQTQSPEGYFDSSSSRAESNSNAEPASASAGTNPLAAEHHRVVASAAANLKQYYFNSAVGAQMSDALLAHEQRGDDNAATDGSAFANLLTRQIRDVSHDLHLDVLYSADPLPELRDARAPAPEDLARYRQAMQQQNCTFEKVELLPDNIGYLKLNSFPDPSVCQSAATGAMQRMNDADALIFDLRDNRGGSPDMVMLLASYLFDHPEYMYSPRENTSARSWTRSPVPGNRLADKPVFILTSHSTASAAEHFSYDLKMLKRATIVGETTGGAAHSGVFHRLDDHFGIGIPEVDPINPFAKSDWAVVGVAPDVKVSAAEALATARKLAAAHLQKH